MYSKKNIFIKNKKMKGLFIMKGKKVIYNGVEYSSIKSLCESCNVSYAMVTQRLKTGMSIEEAINIPLKTHRNGIKIVYDGIEYPSIRSLAKAKNIPYHVIQMRLKKGMSIKKAIETPVGELMGNEIVFKNKKYSSFSKLCKAFNIPPSIALSRLNMNWSLEKTLTTPVRKTKNRYIPQLTYNGKDYSSLKVLCDDLNIDYQNTLNRLHRGKTLKEAIETPKRTRKNIN